MKNDKLSVHSYETFGTVDGPGIRFVLFLNGCPLRCLYCHNPDTLEYKSDKMVEIKEIVKEILKYTSFSKTGAVTVSGGEPLLQSEALVNLFKELKKLNVHTCVDTSGHTKLTNTIKELLEYTDLVLLDIKHIDNDKHLKLTKVENTLTLDFLEYLSSINKKTWIRYVLLPSYTDDEKDLKDLKTYLNNFKNIEKVEILPYHKLGIEKYEKLGIDYQLKNVTPPTDKELAEAKKILCV